MSTEGKKILVVDNHDSFVFNIVQYLDELGATTLVVKSDEIDPEFCKNFDGVVISPGPGNPQSAGASIGAVKYCDQEEIPVLGICLGLQVIGAAYGAKISSAPELLHGRTSKISHNSENIFRDIPNNFTATRYHSLAIEPDSLPEILQVTAQSGDGTIMGIRHRAKNIVGVQFHPEAVLTEFGYELLANWLELCGDVCARNRAVGLSALVKNS
ncbi:MAG: gamma-glutamyl-gamma-aminobutyrate hydrolase family protein [Actinomycetes bacterium]